jgi:cell division control protein 45
MILDYDHWYLGYEEILNNCQQSTQEDGVPGTCLILCNSDVDAMAAARILTYMLRLDGIPYNLLPCSNQSSLEHQLKKTPMDDIKAVIMLNFGAARNMTRLFEANTADDENEEKKKSLLPTSVKVYVIDCRRPVHLANIYAGDNVVIFWDQTNGADPLPSDGDNLSGNEDSSDDEDSSSSSSSDNDSDDSSDDEDGEDNSDAEDGEEEANFDDVAGVVQQQPSNAEESDVDYDGEDEREETNRRSSRRTRQASRANDDADHDDDASASSSSSQKRQRTDDPADPAASSTGEEGATDAEPDSPDSVKTANDNAAPQEEEELVSPQELHRRRRESLRKYYSSGSFFGSPASYVAFKLATQLRFGEQADLLWYACVGITDAYLHSRLDVAGYTTLALDMRRYCHRMFPNDMFERAMNTVYAEDLMGGSGLGGGNGGDNSNSRTKITFDENGRIVSGKDYRFFLLRHSSLLDSMMYSDVVSTKLQIWTKQGKHQLQELLAKMGYPLDECQQPFAFMRPTLKRQLNEKIQLHANVSTLKIDTKVLTPFIHNFIFANTFMHLISFYLLLYRNMDLITLSLLVSFELLATNRSSLPVIPRTLSRPSWNVRPRRSLLHRERNSMRRVRSEKHLTMLSMP